MKPNYSAENPQHSLEWVEFVLKFFDGFDGIRQFLFMYINNGIMAEWV